jgi:hypothetical protein
MSMIHRFATVGLVATFVGAAFAAEDKPKKITSGALSFEVPPSWKTEKPSNSMRAAQLSIDPVKGDEDPAALVVNVFPGGAGSLDANIERWEKGFIDADKKTPKAKVEKKKGINVDVTRVEVSGHYVASISPGRPGNYDKEGYKLLGAIVQTSGGSYFFKLTGPEKTISAAAKGFDEMIESIKIDK